jgi:hypothetical protein
LLVAGSLAGCVVYDPARVQRADSGADGGVMLAHPPPRPSGMDTSMPGEVAFGLRDVVLNQTAEQARMLGYDLDDYDTTDTNLLSECTPGMGGRVPADGPGGIDNVFGASLYPLVNAAVPGLEDRARAAQMAGNGLPVLRVRGWNGTPNDPVIDVTISAAVFSAGTGGSMAPAVVIHSPTDYTLMDGSPVPGPRWDGNDWTWLRTDSFLGGDLEQPLIRDQQAYVADGVFVANLPERVDIVFPTDTVGVLVRLTGAVATGTLSADGTRLENVIVAGRWSTTDLLSTAENIGLCMGTGQYNILQSQLVRYADVRSRMPAPGDPVLGCDALSIGVGFTGFRMRVAGVTDGLPILDLCTMDGGLPDAGTDAAMTPSDAGTDAGHDAAMSMDAGVDANVDGG